MSSLHTMAIVFMAALLIFFIIIGIWARKEKQNRRSRCRRRILLGR